MGRVWTGWAALASWRSAPDRLTALDQPIAVVLDLMHPARPGRRLGTTRRDTWLYEPGGACEWIAVGLGLCVLIRLGASAAGVIIR
jgi:hypothetical protein